MPTIGDTLGAGAMRALRAALAPVPAPVPAPVAAPVPAPVRRAPALAPMPLRRAPVRLPTRPASSADIYGRVPLNGTTVRASDTSPRTRGRRAPVLVRDASDPRAPIVSLPRL
jgi:hypothetical protein